MGGRGAGTREQADVTRTEGEGRGGRGREGRCAAEGCAGADVTREAGEGRAQGPERVWTGRGPQPNGGGTGERSQRRFKEKLQRKHQNEGVTDRLKIRSE